MQVDSTNFEALTNGDSYCQLVPARQAGPTIYNVAWNVADRYVSGSTQIGVSADGKTATSPSPPGEARAIRATLARSSGKWYFEIVLSSGGGSFDAATPGVGLADASAVLNSIAIGNATATSYRLQGNGNKISNSGGSSAYGSGIGSGGTVMMAVDLDNGFWWAGLNGTWFASGNPATGANPGYSGVTGSLMPCFGASSGFAISAIGAWKGADLTYAPPSGFKPWAGG